ncbi:MAG: PilZ domain-containing protein [Deltaproteobacteria bacterium]|nr:PilZ domain-containing protein [Deltaproteobacteria bacterium]
MAKSDIEQNQREHYRINYPELERPQLQVGKVVYKVLDVSERGIRFLLPAQHGHIENQVVKGTLVFRSGKRVAIEGKIIRIMPLELTCSLHLKRSIPLAYIMEEQRILLQKYNEL